MGVAYRLVGFSTHRVGLAQREQRTPNIQKTRRSISAAAGGEAAPGLEGHKFLTPLKKGVTNAKESAKNREIRELGFAGDSPVERESKSGNRTLFLGQSATPGPGLFEVRPSTSPNRSAETRLDELLIRMSRTEGLPPPNTRRWVIRRKAAVVGAVRSGAISLQDACRRYQLSEEEFLSWE